MLLSETCRNKGGLVSLQPYGPRRPINWAVVGVCFLGVAVLVLAGVLWATRSDSGHRQENSPATSGGDIGASQDATTAAGTARLTTNYKGSATNHTVERKLGLPATSNLEVHFESTRAKSLSGTIKVNGPWYIEGSGNFTGTLSGNKIVLNVRYIDSQNNPQTYRLVGTVSNADGTMEGNMEVSPSPDFPQGQTGTWTLQPA